MASKTAEEPRFSILSQENVKHCAEAVGVTGLDGSLTKSLAEDATYRLRQVVQSAYQFMKHAKRRRMTTEDLNRAMQLNSVEPVFGYGSGEDMPFRSTSTKDGDIYFVDDKEICIRELALGNAVPTDPGKVTVKAQWLCIEGVHPPANHTQSGAGRQSVGSENGGQHKPLSEVCLGYYEQITKAILGESEKCRKLALDDLRSNSKIASLLAYFVNFIASGVKSYSNDLKQLSHLLGMVRALTDNPSLFLEPYVIQLVTAVMYCLLETLAVSLNPANDHWRLRDDAARILAHISRKCSNPVNYLRQQLLMTLQEVLLDDGRPYCSHYGAVVGLVELGAEALEQFLLPHLNNYWQQLQQVLEDNTLANAVLQEEAVQVYGALLQAAGCLLKSKSQGVPMNTCNFPVNNNSHPLLRANLSPWPGASTMERRPAPVSSTRSRSTSTTYNLPNQSYSQLYDVFGDSLLPQIAFNNWQESSVTKNNIMRIQPLAHAHFPLRPLQRDVVVIRELIEKAREKLEGPVGTPARALSHAGRKRSRTDNDDDDDDDSTLHHEKRQKGGKYSSLVIKSAKLSPTLCSVFEMAGQHKKGSEHSSGGTRKKGGRFSKKKSADTQPKETETKKRLDPPGKKPRLETGSLRKMFRRARPIMANKVKYDYHIGITL